MMMPRSRPLTIVSLVAQFFLPRSRNDEARVSAAKVMSVAILVMGLPLWALYLVGFLQAVPPIHLWQTIHWAVLFGSLWIILSPALVAQWELGALSGALHHLRQLSSAQGMQGDIATRLWRAWPVAFLPSAFSFAAFTIFLFVFYRGYLSEDILILDGTPVFYLTFTIVTITGFITGIGVGGVVFAIWALGQVLRSNLEWKPFHSDQRGGYGFLASFAVETAVLFSCGSVVVPAAITIAYKVGWPLSAAMSGATIFYAVMIFAIFAWPMSALTFNADRCRRKYLDDYSEGISYAISQSRQLKAGEAMASVQLADVERAATHIAPAEKLIFMFDKIAARSVLPFRVGLLARVLIAGLTPIILMIVQLAIQRALPD